MAEIYDAADRLPQDLLETCYETPWPQTVLMCEPTYFEVADVKNPHMADHLGAVNYPKAQEQWERLVEVFRGIGLNVEFIDPVELCEDMVFCANQTLAGLNDGGEKVCVLSQMKHPSRQREVPAFGEWFERRGYAIDHLPGDEVFEGSGDAIWHPRRGLLWGGYGYRTDPDAYEAVGDYFGVPVLRVELKSDSFYHLDTAFCPLNENTVLIYPRGMSEEGQALVRAVFERVIECDEREALKGFACNAAAFLGQHVVIQKGNPKTIQALKEHGLTVHEVDTSEFMKSGGSVFCMKMYVF